MKSQENQRKIFKQIINNAFDNIQQSIAMLDSDPKLSVILFYSGIEMFFKARLFIDNWFLILDDIDKVNNDFETFRKGDFITVTLEKAGNRIHLLLNDLDKHYEAKFDELRKIRNRLIHFDLINLLCL